jgi:adenylate kinase family enzyme
MSLWSFLRFMNEGVHDPSTHKIFYVVGGPGSGKSYVSKRTMGGLGLKTVNSDEVYENEMKKQGLEMTPENIYSPRGQAIRDRAKKITANREKLYTQGRLGMIMDGTGKDFEKVRQHAEKMKQHGYEPHMVFVNTSLDVAKQRNRQRARQLPDSEVEKMHGKVQNNLGKFQEYFGHNMHIVDNSVPDEDVLHKLHKTIRKASGSPVRHPIAKQWQQGQIQQKQQSFPVDD